MGSKDLPASPDKLLQALNFATELAEKEEAFTREIQELLLRFLEVKDSVEHLVEELSRETSQKARETARMARRIQLLNRQIDLALQRSGVQAIESIGKEANPHVHHIEKVIHQPGAKANVIVAELVKGYTYKEEILRRPRVTVTSPSASRSSSKKSRRSKRNS